MPIYEYRCTGCGGEFEYQQRMSEDAKTECETCGGALERLISLSAFHLKGAGWYKDLYSSSKPDKSSSDSDAASASSDPGSSESSSSGSGSSESSSKDSSSKDSGSKSSGGDSSSSGSSTSTSNSAS